MFSKKNNHQSAFTLIELLFTVAIISLLSALVLSSLASARMKTNDTKISEDLRQFRTAVDLYYNDNKTYPSTAMNYKDGNLAVQDRQDRQDGQGGQYSWVNKLSFFVKTAEAAVAHNSPLCKNFDKVASTLVASKYLTNIPVHPYDNDAKGICYKAVSASGTFSAYASLTSLMSVGSGASSGTISKRTGFITGDTSSSGITNLVAATNSSDSSEIPYPIGTDANTALDIAKSADAIYGVVAGIPGSGGAGSIVTNTIPTTYTLSASVLAGGPGAGSISYTPNKTTYSPGDVVNFTAVPGTGYSLTYWTGGCTSTGINTCFIIMDSNKTVQASFNLGYNFSVVNSNPSNGSVSYAPLNASYQPNDIITVTAFPNSGYAVSSWSGCTSSSGNTCSVTMGSVSKIVNVGFVTLP